MCFINLSGQGLKEQLKQDAIRIDNPEQLTDGVYQLLSPFHLLMVGEMHGTNEPAACVAGLARLFTSKGDSVQVGLEIPADKMKWYLSTQTDSSIYQSDFFARPNFNNGRESVAWANIIARLMGNPKIQIFFFDVNEDEMASADRDSIMYSKIKARHLRFPTWKMITLSGNLHVSNRPGKMFSFLLEDEAFEKGFHICTLNNYYSKGTCRANFGKGLEVRNLENNPGIFDTSLPFDKYLYLFPPGSNFPYSGIYYTRFITASDMVKS